jgi:hypothetical protein
MEDEMTVGTDLITAERKRQIESEGWTLEHDRIEHDGGDALAMAAVTYALPYYWRDGKRMEFFWPWIEDSFKPTATEANLPTENRIRELTKAGALIAAEIDRLSTAQVMRETARP